MKSRTSSCKKTAFRKDMTRFWPVWVGYILFLAIIQLLISEDDLTYWYASNLGESISLMGLVNAGYALLVALMLFGDLFNSRMCSGIHALPLRREQWFGVHVKAGFLFSLIPTAVMTLFSLWMIDQYSTVTEGWQVPLLWFAASNLQYIFFFGLAVFCALCAGSRFGATVIYGIFNFFSSLIYVLMYQIYVPMLFGVVSQYTLFQLAGPVVHLCTVRFVDLERMFTGNTYLDSYGIEQREFIGTVEIVPESWIYVGIIALAGIVLLRLARRMYRNRHLEYAGDFLAVRWLQPVFQVVFTILCAAGLQGMVSIFLGSGEERGNVLLYIGLIVGWFAGRMLLERSTRVFRLKNILGALMMTAALAGSLFLTRMDPLGLEDWIPKVGTVKTASLQLYYRDGHTTEIPQEIADLTRLHELALEQRISLQEDLPHEEMTQITISYTLNNGWKAERQYYVLAEGESGDIVRDYLSRLDVVISREDVKTPEDLRRLMKETTEIILYGYSVDPEYLTEEFLISLADAIIADCEAGSMVQSSGFHPGPVLGIENGSHQMSLDIYGQADKNCCWMEVYADSENILAALEPTGILDQIRAEYENAYG